MYINLINRACFLILIFLSLSLNTLSKDLASPKLISCNLIAEPIINGNYIDLKTYIQSDGDDFYLGRSTFAFNYDKTKLKFESLLTDTSIIFNNKLPKGYKAITSYPPDSIKLDYQTIEINYDTTAKPQLPGLIVPKTKTYLGTLRFKILNVNTSFVFSWHTSTIIRTINNTNINILTTRSDFKEFLLYSAKLVSPVGGESFYPDRKTDIKWTSTANYPIYIQFTTDGNDWVYLEPKPIMSSKLSYTWTIPLANSQHCSIRLIDSASKAVLSQTPEFSVFPGFSYFLRPSSGDALYYGGKSDVLQWTCQGFNKLKFDVSTNGGSSWTLIASPVIASVGELTWKIPSVTTKSALVRMIDFETGKEICQSGTFKILQGNLTFKNPILNETILVNKTYRVRWTFVNLSDFDLEYSIDGGKSWINIAYSVNAINGYYDWKVPNTDTKTAVLRALFNNDTDMEYGKSGIFIMKNPVGIEELDQTAEIYPNPTSDFINIKLDNQITSNIEGYNLEIYNQLGEKIKSPFVLENESLRIDVSSLPKGIYLIKLNDKTYSFLKN
jgi:hypothetical protein